ncbi:YagK/YfjJ domain-containing protein [Modicisalibacter xianhensis]|uniref:YagK/YfjJ C-terminal domain-containing protein n=1 Tax=Modicisalibacter xianhensis TaxID=442341 RepID=A0A1I2ZKL5_9GAMM|nr:inovirus-type Gp2 protein [Halomonas xianhensis]SFH38397.1 Protein of unknown function [Halomonas xianhensis]
MTYFDVDYRTPLNDDVISDDAMREIMLEAGHSSEFISMTTAQGTMEYIDNDQGWLNELIEVDKNLKACCTDTCYLNIAMLAQPVVYDSDNYVLRGSPLLDALIEAYVALDWVFYQTSIGQHYRPSPYAETFLRAFRDCAFLHACIETDTPIMSWVEAENTVTEINNRLLSWRSYISTRSFDHECKRAYYNSRRNRKSMREWVNALFQKHAYLQVIRVDLGYRKDIATSVPYEMASTQRAKFCKYFHHELLFAHMVGYAWKLEWGVSRGFHYHFLFFFDASQVQNDVLRAQWIGEYWSQKITNGDGTYYSCNHNADTTYYYNALGKMAYHDVNKRQGLEYIISYLTKPDEYASLAVSGRTFFHSRTPHSSGGPRPGRPRQYPSAF